MKLKCKCEKLATWYYMPSDRNHACCDDCVPRGCTCNDRPVEWKDEDEIFQNPPEGVEGKDWEWIEKNIYYRQLDGEGKQLPCCEWWYDEEGWDNEN